MKKGAYCQEGGCNKCVNFEKIIQHLKTALRRMFVCAVVLVHVMLGTLLNLIPMGLVPTIVEHRV